jgi:hypothetical protein
MRFVDKLWNLKEVALAWRIIEAFTPTTEDIAAHQGQHLGQLRMLFLEFVVVSRGLIEYTLEFFHSTAGVLGLLLGVLDLLLGELGLLPQLIVAAEQVLEELLVVAWIVRNSQRHAHVIKDIRTLM